MFEAQHALERALLLHKRGRGGDSAEAHRCAKQVADVCNSLAMQYLQQVAAAAAATLTPPCTAPTPPRRPQDAFAAALMLLKKAEGLASRHRPLLAITLNNLACYYRRRAQPKISLSYLQKVRARAPARPHARARARARARTRARKRARAHANAHARTQTQRAHTVSSISPIRR